MRKIIQQMLKGEQVAFCESVQTELKALAAEKEKALASLQELFAESEKKNSTRSSRDGTRRAPSPSKIITAQVLSSVFLRGLRRRACSIKNIPCSIGY